MSIIDKRRFEAGGAVGCSNSEYEPCRTTCCHRFCVEDVELSDLYLSPNDLSNRVSLLRHKADIEPFPCPLCGAADWAIARAPSLEDVPEAWRWVCSDV